MSRATGPDGRMPLSCTSCRQRKVKCDKTQPCSACQKSGLDCVFPARTRIPRGRQGGLRARNEELSKRLSRLENFLERLGPQGLPSSSESADTAASTGTPMETTPAQPAPRPIDSLDTTSPQSSEASSKKSNPDPDPASLRYASTEYWKGLIGEVDGMRQVLEDSDDEEEEENEDISPQSSRPEASPFQGNLFILRSTVETQGLASLHPSREQILYLADIFFARVDSMFKVIHRPTVRTFLEAAAEATDTVPINSGLECLIFAVYFSSVTSLKDEECTEKFGVDRESLIAKYKYGVEAAFTNADLLNSTDLVTLQAFCIYLAFLRAITEQRTVWTLTALALRIAQDLDLNRDLSGFKGITPFDVEMRRRLFWAIAVLDMRGAEDRGMAPMIPADFMSTKYPTMIDDDDMDPASTTEYKEQKFSKDMTFMRVCYECGGLLRRLYLPPGMSEDEKLKRNKTPQDREQMVLDFGQHLQDKYIKGLDDSVPIFFAATTLSKLICLKLYLTVQYPFSYGDYTVPRDTPRRYNSLEIAVAILELAKQFGTHGEVGIWSAYTWTWVPWHPLAVAFAELCSQTSGSLVDRAWEVAEPLFQFWSQWVADSKRGPLWRPIRRLYARAKKAREAEAKRAEFLEQNLSRLQSSGMLGALPTQQPAPPMARGPLNIPDFTVPPLQWNDQNMVAMPEGITQYLHGNANPFGPSIDFTNVQLPPMYMDTTPALGSLDPTDWSVWDDFVGDAMAAQGFSIDPMSVENVDMNIGLTTQFARNGAPWADIGSRPNP